jgi:nitrite reductase (NO-forming)
MNLLPKRSCWVHSQFNAIEAENMKSGRKSALIAVAALLLTAPAWSASRDDNAREEVIGTEEAILTDAPAVPAPIHRDHATKVVVHLEIKEVEGRMADGVTYTFWTFGGKVPGKFIRVREGDMVEMHLENHPGNKIPHNIDLHAVNGPGGGAAASLTAPGHTSVFSFKALNPGLYVYHCATAPVAMHVANGMYGLILVEPKEGLSKVDREFYVMQGDFYTKGANGEKGLQPFSMSKAIDEKPDYVVFNGSVGSTTGDQALTATVGESVRFFVGDGGPTHNVQTTMIPAGGSAIVEFKLSVPGTFIVVDHSLSRAFNRGALAQLKIGGDENKTVYSGKTGDEVYLPEGAGARVAEQSAQAPAAKNKVERIKAGEGVFVNNCQACHQANGAGVADAFPPLAKSDYLNADKIRAIKAVTGGLEGKLTVNGRAFNGVMPAWDLPDEDVANVMTYIYNSWGNSGLEVRPADVQANRVKKN